MFLKSQSSSASEAKTGAVRRRAAIPNRDGDGQIIADGPRQRGPGGGRRRMQRRTQAQEEEPIQDVIDEPRVDGEIDSDDEGNPSKISGKLGKKNLFKML